MAKDEGSLEQILSGIGAVLDGLSGLAERGADWLQSGGSTGHGPGVTYGWSIGSVADRNVRKARPTRSAAPVRPAGRRAAVREVFDEGEFVRMVIEMPGVVNDEIRFEVNGQELTVQARRHDGRCTQRLIVPAPVCVERATSSYRNGIFEIQLPKRRPDDERRGGEAEHGSR